MFICMDANFRLKNQLVSNYSQDPGLGIGWAYMVPRKSYEEYILSQTNDDDVSYARLVFMFILLISFSQISTCVGLQALAKANTKFSTGLRYTGVNMAVCGRSEMIFPTAVGNLPKGERFVQNLRLRFFFLSANSRIFQIREHGFHFCFRPPIRHGLNGSNKLRHLLSVVCEPIPTNGATLAKRVTTSAYHEICSRHSKTS